MSIRTGVDENKKNILNNKFSIEQNKSAIHELKTNCTNNCVPYAVFESAIAKYDKIVHRLIVALCIVVALLFISNAVWLYAWNHIDFGKEETTFITKDGVSNVIGKDGVIDNLE